MAGKGAVALDKVVINIESSAGNTHKNIDKLATSLEHLKKSINGGFNNMNKLADAIRNLTKASNKLPETVKNLKGLSRVVETLKSLSSIEKPSGLISTINALEKIPKTFNAINPKSLENVKRVSSELASALSPLSEKLQNIGNGFTALSKLAKTYGVQITRVSSKTKDVGKEFNTANRSISAMGTVFKKVGEIGSSAGNKFMRIFKKVHSKIKQIGLSLLGTRTIFTMTRKAVSEYMAMDQELTKATQNVWRALGAQLAPAIEYVIYLFKQAVRVIYSIVYALTGIDLIARANAKALAAMGKAAKDTLGNLQKFDDLNVVTFDKGSGDDYKIELDKIDLTPIQKVIDWMKKLKKAIEDAWKSGQWNGVAKVLAEGINGAINAIDAKSIGKKITDALTGVLDFISTMIADVDWGTLGVKIRETFENIDWYAVWTSIRTTAEEVLLGLKDFVKGLFDFNESEWDGLIAAIGAVGAAFVTWKIIDTWNKFVTLLETAGLLTGASGITTIGLSTMATWLGVIALAISGIILGIQGVIDLFDNNIWDGIQKILVGIALVLAGIALAVGSMPVLIAAGVAVIIALIVKVVQEIVKNWEKIKKTLSKVWKWIDENVIQLIVDSWNDFMKTLEIGFKGLGNFIMIVLEGIANIFVWLFNLVIKGLNKIQFTAPDWVPEIGGKKFGINIDLIPKVSLPKFDIAAALATGTNEIEYEGLYHLHEGEAVVPKKYNPALGNGTDEELGQKMDTLITIMSNMNFTNVVNIGNKTLYKEQQRYNKTQNDKYGTTVNL